MEAIEKHDGLPVFTVKSATGALAISAELTTRHSLSWFKDEKFGGEFKRCDVTVKPGDRTLAVVHIYPVTDEDDKDTGEMGLGIEVHLAEQEFDRLLRAAWSGREPCSLFVQIQAVCFQNPAEGLYPRWLAYNFVFDAEHSIMSAKLGLLRLVQTTGDAPDIPGADLEEADQERQRLEAQPHPTLAALAQLQSTVRNMERSLWWIAALVVAITLSLLLHR